MLTSRARDRALRVKTSTSIRETKALIINWLVRAQFESGDMRDKLEVMHHDVKTLQSEIDEIKRMLNEITEIQEPE